MRGPKQVYGTCRQRKGFVDCQAFVHQQIIPKALRRGVHTVTFILDNGTTHAPKQLEGRLREQEGACDGQLHFQVLCLPTNAYLSRSARNLVQRAAAQTLATQSLAQHQGPRTLSQRVHRPSPSGCQTHQVDLDRREAGTETRKPVMIACRASLPSSSLVSFTAPSDMSGFSVSFASTNSSAISLPSSHTFLYLFSTPITVERVETNFYYYSL
jgi:hypothetical protein